MTPSPLRSESLDCLILELVTNTSTGDAYVTTPCLIIKIPKGLKMDQNNPLALTLASHNEPYGVVCISSSLTIRLRTVTHHMWPSSTTVTNQ